MSGHYFTNKEILKDLGSRSAKGGLWMAGGRVIQFSLELTTICILARTLSPKDFGIVGMVTIIFLIIKQFSNLGLERSIIQKDTISEQAVCSIFWGNTIFGLTITIIIYSSAPLISHFYNTDELINITKALAPTILLSGITIQHSALMLRAFEFKNFTIIDISATLLSSLVAVFMAYKGYGYWALVFRMICWAVFRLVFILLATAWIPKFPNFKTNIKPYLNYGLNLAGFNLVHFFVRNFDSILIGKLFGASILGFYTRAYRLILTPCLEINLPLYQVILPSLSRVQNDPVRFRSIYIKFLSLVSCITIPLIIFVCISAKDLFFILLGPGWDKSAEFILLLMPLAYVNATNFSDEIVYQGMGTTNRQLKWYLLMSPLILLSMWIGSFWGANGVAIGTSLSFFSIRPFSLYYCYRETHITLGDFFRASIRTSIISAISATITIFVFNKIDILLTLNDISAYINFTIKGSIYVLMWGILECYIGGGPKLFTLLTEFKSQLKKSRN